MQSSDRLRTTESTESSPELDEQTSGANEIRPRWRIWTIVGVFGALTLLLGVQILRYQLFPPALESPPENTATGNTSRGTIVDRNGMPLVVNRHYYQLTATPAHINTQEARHEVATQLQELIDLPYEHTYAVLSESPEAMYAILSDAISLEEAERITQRQAELEATRTVFPLQYVKPVAMTKRYYPQNELTAHVIGFVQPGAEGRYGIEEYYNEFLKSNGKGLLSQQMAGVQQLSADVRHFVPSSVGKDLVLTVDTTVQWILYEELLRGLEEFEAESGTAIVMEPDTGAILGLINLPSFDPNRYAESVGEHIPNPAISAQYEPGSIFKIITMAAALDSGVITPTTPYTDTGSIAVGGRVILNSDRMAHGRVSATQALARSLNVVTAQIAQDMGAEEFYRYLSRFGFNGATNIDLSREVDGQVKFPGANLSWSEADLGTNSFGQGLAVTPIQILNATAAIANGGKLMQPHVVNAQVMGDDVEFTDPVTMRQALRPETSAQMREMMREVVETGNTRAGVPGYEVAGKSGTAQIPSPEGYLEDDTIVSFVGFAPADHPRFVLLVKMDRPNPELNSWASQTAAPVFGRIAERLLTYLSVPPKDMQIAAGASDTAAAAGAEVASPSAASNTENPDGRGESVGVGE